MRCFAETDLWPGGPTIDARNMHLCVDGGDVNVALDRLDGWAHDKCNAALTLVITGKSERSDDLNDGVFALFPSIRYLLVRYCNQVTASGIASLKLMETLHVVGCKRLAMIHTTRVLDLLTSRHALRHVKWWWSDEDGAPINVFGGPVPHAQNVISRETDLAALHAMGAVHLELNGVRAQHAVSNLKGATL